MRWSISRGPTFEDFVTIRTERSMQDLTVARLQSTRVQTPLSPSFKCNVLRESLSEGSQNIPCATLKRRGSYVISVYLWVRPNEQQRRFNEWPISELHGGGRFHPNQFKIALAIMKCRLCLDIPTSYKVIEYLVGKTAAFMSLLLLF
jgi:hypothetical protein